MAVLVEIVMLPFESVEVTGTWTATGVVGSVVVGTRERVMMVLWDAAVDGFGTTGSILVIGCVAARTVEVVGDSTAVAVPAVGTRSDATVINTIAGSGIFEIFCEETEAMSGGSTLSVGISVGTASCDFATGGCVIEADVFVEVGKLSGSVDVDVVVRYIAVSITIAGDTQVAAALQFQMPKPGKRFLKRMSPKHVLPFIATKVQPLGSSIVSTPSVCTRSGRSG